MTQPVQEPTQGRINQGLEFRTKQLFRRPAPAGGAGTYRNAVQVYKFIGIDWQHIDDGGSPFYNALYFAYATDANAPGGYVFTNAGSDEAGDYFVLGATLGPKGSAWYPDIAYQVSPNGGQVIVEVQTQPVDYSASYPELITRPDQNGTWIPWLNSIDTYNALTSYAVVSGYGGDLVVDGDAGAMLTAETGYADIPPYPAGSRLFDGGGDGSVMWYWRFRVLETVNGSNVSGNKRFQIASFRLSRVQYNGGAAW